MSKTKDPFIRIVKRDKIHPLLKVLYDCDFGGIGSRRHFTGCNRRESVGAL